MVVTKCPYYVRQKPWGRQSSLLDYSDLDLKNPSENP